MSLLKEIANWILSAFLTLVVGYSVAVIILIWLVREQGHSISTILPFIGFDLSA